MTKSLLSIHAKSFSWAGFFLPKNKYKDSSDLYDFCRTLDDIVDQDLLLSEKIKKFNSFKKDFENKNFEGKTITLIGEVPDLKVLRWGDKISSIKIQRAQKDINVALAFQHSDFKGEFLNLNLE